MSKCKCGIAISVLGDGCRYCQPQEYINQLNLAYDGMEEENDELLEKTENLQRQLAEDREEKECLRMLLLNWSGLSQSDIENELKKFKGE